MALYTRIAPNIEPLTARRLAELSIASAQSSELAKGRDGISYLIAAKRNGIVTLLTPEYEREILELTSVKSLEDALKIYPRRRAKRLFPRHVYGSVKGATYQAKRLSDLVVRLAGKGTTRSSDFLTGPIGVNVGPCRSDR